MTFISSNSKDINIDQSAYKNRIINKKLNAQMTAFYYEKPHSATKSPVQIYIKIYPHKTAICRLSPQIYRVTSALNVMRIYMDKAQTITRKRASLHQLY